MKQDRRKGNPDKVHPAMARKALERAKGDKRKAYSECVQLSFRSTGMLSPGFDVDDLMAFYQREGL